MSGMEEKPVRVDTYYMKTLIDSRVVGNTVYIFDPSAFKAEVDWEPVESEPVDFAGAATRMRYEMRLGFDPAGYTYEDVPCVQLAAHSTFRSWLRALAALVAYDHRKATGKLRRWPKRCAVLTGITA